MSDLREDGLRERRYVLDVVEGKTGWSVIFTWRITVWGKARQVELIPLGSGPSGGTGL